LDFENWINNTGIILEIIGFLLILRATGHLKPSGGSFTSAIDNIENVMSIIRPRFYYLGIVLVIVGLALQIVPSFIFTT
jgi:hypothetical protein